MILPCLPPFVRSEADFLYRQDGVKSNNFFEWAPLHFLMSIQKGYEKILRLLAAGLYLDLLGLFRNFLNCYAKGWIQES